MDQILKKSKSNHLGLEYELDHRLKKFYKYCR